MTFEFHPEAEVELIEAAAYYERHVPGLGERFQSEIRRVVDLLVSQPQIGAPVDSDLRKFVLPRFPFAVYYSITQMFFEWKLSPTTVGVHAIGRTELSSKGEICGATDCASFYPHDRLMTDTIRRASIQDLDRLVPLLDAYRQFYGQPSDLIIARQFLGDRLTRNESIVLGKV